MTLTFIGCNYKYETENIIRLFFPHLKVKITEERDCDFYVEIKKENGLLTVKYKKDNYEKIVSEKSECDNELQFCTMLYKILQKNTGITPEWGIQTGIRPVKLFREKSEEYLRKKLLVSEKKILLSKETLENETKILSKLMPNSYSLYISIPFCPSRCSYCSFISHDVNKMREQLPQYIKNLCEELKIISEIANKNKLTLQTIYIGGGTPTILDADELYILFSVINKYFDTKHTYEYTLEAGRPDTITKEKLQIIKKHGVNRVSVNPQTLDDNLLINIKRNHTAQQFYEAFMLTRDIGFNIINVDLIAGLNGDTLKNFKNTVDKIIELNPENITIHTLTLKRASTVSYNEEAVFDPIGELVSQMVDYSYSALKKTGFFPYYLYRQNKSAGNLENVGYSKKGRESLYNVYIMDECQTILAAGAGAVSKIVSDKTGCFRIKRIFNHKYPYEYNNRFCEIISKKNAINDLFLLEI